MHNAVSLNCPNGSGISRHLFQWIANTQTIKVNTPPPKAAGTFLFQEIVLIGLVLNNSPYRGNTHQDHADSVNDIWFHMFP